MTRPIRKNQLKRAEIGSQKAGVEMHTGTKIRVRYSKNPDLDQVNAVIEQAIMTWDLPDRIRRLIRPAYQYDGHDLRHLTMLVAENDSGDIVGVAAWEPANSSDTPRGLKGLLLHGIYVSPEFQRLGIGNRMVNQALHAAREAGCAGVLAKANRNARDFYRATGWQLVKVKNPNRDYPYRFWLESRDD